MKRSIGIAALIAISFAAAPAAADRDEPSPELIAIGERLYQQGNLRGAFHAFQAAHEVSRNPLTALALAKGQFGVGMLVEAEATLDAAAQLPERAGEPDIMRSAREEARRASLRLAPRVPRLRALIDGIAARGATIEVDGVRATGLETRVNPGLRHIVVLSPGFARYEEDLTFGEGSTRSLRLALVPVVRQGKIIALDVEDPWETGSPGAPPFLERQVPHSDSASRARTLQAKR